MQYLAFIEGIKAKILTQASCLSLALSCPFNIHNLLPKLVKPLSTKLTFRQFRNTDVINWCTLRSDAVHCNLFWTITESRFSPLAIWCKKSFRRSMRRFILIADHSVPCQRAWIAGKIVNEEKRRSLFPTTLRWMVCSRNPRLIEKNIVIEEKYRKNTLPPWATVQLDDKGLHLLAYRAKQRSFTYL